MIASQFLTIFTTFLLVFSGVALLVATSTLAAVVAVMVPVVKARTHVVPGPQAQYEQATDTDLELDPA